MAPGPIIRSPGFRVPLLLGERDHLPAEVKALLAEAPTGPGPPDGRGAGQRRDGSGDSLRRGQAAPASRALPGFPAGGHSSSCLSHLNDARACGAQGRAGLRPSVGVSVGWYPSEQVQAQKSSQRDCSHSFDKYNSHDHEVKQRTPSQPGSSRRLGELNCGWVPRFAHLPCPNKSCSLMSNSHRIYSIQAHHPHGPQSSLPCSLPQTPLHYLLY